ncbi:ABC transporter permease [uncultured Corynebacterium sp.]|uniref:ABC transporter permease n=1 Tax=uncultured Corynebacterium sp. TaxID=159447 RepID=UPI0025D101A8|nr:ABC transporter permease [uncultured Corynebacterium sp.]
MSKVTDHQDSSAAQSREPEQSQNAQRAPRRGFYSTMHNLQMTKEDKLLVFGTPVLILVVFGIWFIWRATTTLTDVEMRQLAWSVIGRRTLEHLRIVVISAIIVLAVGLPLGIVLTRQRMKFLVPVVTGIGNAGQSALVIGVIVLLAMWLGFGTPVAILSLSLYAFLPVLANTIAGLQGVDKELIESAQGMGMTAWQILWRIEIPLASSAILNGVRTALVLLVGVGAFATFINAGGLGALIQSGIVLFRYRVLVSGAILVALLALFVDWIGRIVEIAVTPKGIS